MIHTKAYSNEQRLLDVMKYEAMMVSIMLTGYQIVIFIAFFE